MENEKFRYYAEESVRSTKNERHSIACKREMQILLVKKGIPLTSNINRSKQKVHEIPTISHKIVGIWYYFTLVAVAVAAVALI